MSDRDKDVDLLETEGEGASPSPAAEAELLRAELAAAQARLEIQEREVTEAKDKSLRARADLENFRRRSLQELERAREAGQDSAVLTVLTVFDDLSRALQMADEDEPGKLIPGLRAVLAGLERNLAALGIERVGLVGEAFNPDLHEALSTLAADDPAKRGLIAQVFEAGFKKGDRLVRPARVVVYQ